MMEKEKTKLSIGEILYLKDRSVDTIIIQYCGGGDSGQIDDIIYTSEKRAQEPDTKKLLISKEIEFKIESIGYELLENIGDWYNNEGGQGTITIKVSDLYYKIDAEYNREETGTYDENNDQWIPDKYQDEPWRETYEGELEKH